MSIGARFSRNKTIGDNPMNGYEVAALRTNEPLGSLEEWTHALVEKLRSHVDPLDGVTRLVRYLSPQVATAVLDCDNEGLFKIQRREITAVFLDLRGFTSFSDSVEPEDFAALLRTYHAEMGELIFKFDGTLEHFAGDGIMVFFNAPIPCEDHTERAVLMALEMCERMKELRSRWLKKGYDLDLGIGLAAGFATVGNIGFEGRMEYGAVGNVTNLASRLCDQAKGGQILTNRRTLSKIENFVTSEQLGEMHLKGFVRPVAAFNILNLKRRQRNSQAETATLEDHEVNRAGSGVRVRGRTKATS
jgi:adenylate cyclase